MIKNVRKQPIITCDLNAIQADQRDKHQFTAQQLLATVEHMRELPDGYALRLPAATSLIKLAEFISLERRCCPFFKFVVEVEPQNGPIWLHLTGAEGVKQFVAAEVGQYINHN
jgi:hypothetical protein